MNEENNDQIDPLISNSNILVVDDMEENVDILVEILSQVGYDVSVALDGESALEVVEEQIPNLILLDIMMPGMNGYQVCEELQKNPKWNKIPVVFISAMNETQDKIQAFQSGGVDYVNKPFQPEEILARVYTHLDLAHTRKDLEKTLSQTLTGTMRMLMDVFTMVQPHLFSWAQKMHYGMKKQSRVLLLKESWIYEMAGMLLPLGMLAMSSQLLERLAQGDVLTDPEKKQLERDTSLGAKMLSAIPKLEEVAEILRFSTLHPRELLSKSADEELSDLQKAGVVLRILRENPQSATAVLEEPSYLPNMLKRHYGIEWKIPQDEEAEKQQNESANEEEFRYEKYALSHMQPGYILQEDVVATDGRKLAGKGFEMTRAALILLEQYMFKGVVPDDQKYLVAIRIS
jgi:CheY-like chemotaxis protein